MRKKTGVLAKCKIPTHMNSTVQSGTEIVRQTRDDSAPPDVDRTPSISINRIHTTFCVLSQVIATVFHALFWGIPIECWLEEP